MTKEELLKVDISNLRFYSQMAEQFKWQTDIIHFGVIAHTLNEIADRLSASQPGEPLQARCPKCGKEKLSEARISSSNFRSYIECKECHDAFWVESASDFAQFFRPSAPSPQKGWLPCGFGCIEGGNYNVFCPWHKHGTMNTQQGSSAPSPQPPKNSRRQVCTCTGSCRGAQGLGPDWMCVMETCGICHWHKSDGHAPGCSQVCGVRVAPSGSAGLQPEPLKDFVICPECRSITTLKVDSEYVCEDPECPTWKKLDPSVEPSAEAPETVKLVSHRAPRLCTICGETLVDGDHNYHGGSNEGDHDFSPAEPVVVSASPEQRIPSQPRPIEPTAKRVIADFEAWRDALPYQGASDDALFRDWMYIRLLELYKAASQPIASDPPNCGKPAASLIPRLGMSWACALPSNHEGECAPGGNCFKHGPYICKPNERPKCPYWPDCIPGLADQTKVEEVAWQLANTVTRARRIPVFPSEKELVTGFTTILSPYFPSQPPEPWSPVIAEAFRIDKINMNCFKLYFFGSFLGAHHSEKSAQSRAGLLSSLILKWTNRYTELLTKELIEARRKLAGVAPSR